MSIVILSLEHIKEPKLDKLNFLKIPFYTINIKWIVFQLHLYEFEIGFLLYYIPPMNLLYRNKYYTGIFKFSCYMSSGSVRFHMILYWCLNRSCSWVTWSGFFLLKYPRSTVLQGCDFNVFGSFCSVLTTRNMWNVKPRLLGPGIGFR